MSKKVYVASSWAKHEEAADVASLLAGMSYEIVSTWHGNPDAEGYETTKDGKELIQEGGKDMAVEASRDLDEVLSCDCLIQLTGDTLTRGGRHTELGIALANSKPPRIVLIGPREQVFHYMPDIEVYADMESFLRAEVKSWVGQ